MHASVLAFALLSPVAVASAQSSPPVAMVDGPISQTTEVRYTPSILVADGIAATSFLAGGAMGMWCFAETFELFTDERPDDHPSCTLAPVFFGTSLGTYAFASPIIHLKHGRRGAALKSLGLRVGLPTGLGALGYQLGDRAAAGGIIIGALIAMGIDWNTLSAYEVESGPMIAPTVAALEGGAAFGVGGTF